MGHARWPSGAPPSLALGQQPLYQRLIGFWGAAMAAFGIPVPALLAIALRMSQPKIEQIICAAQAAWQNMLDSGPKATFGVKTQPATADQAFSGPEAIGVVEGRIGFGDTLFLHSRHRALYPAWLMLCCAPWFLWRQV